MTSLETGVELEGEVVDDFHTFYLPAIVKLGRVRRPDTGESLEDMELIICHGAMRGELYNGYRVCTKAELVEVSTPAEGTRRAVLVTDSEVLIQP